MYSAPEPLELIKRLPKCNLHTHLEGSVRPETFLDLAQKRNLSLSFDPDDLNRHFQVTGEETSLVDYLNKIFVNYQVLNQAEALSRTAYEASLDAHNDGVIYFELRAGPLTHVHPDLPLELCLESILDGLAAAEKEFGIVCRLIAAGLRNHSPEDNLCLAEAAVQYQEAGIVGFDLAGDEEGYSASLHSPAFNALRDSGLGITLHAGEAGGWKNVTYAVNELGADRIGHGIRAVESPLAMDLLAEKQILLEICPTSNVHTRTVPSIESHPVREIYEAGIPISIGDDDPITSRTRVSAELTILNQVHGFTIEEIKEIQIESVRHSFLSDQQMKQELIKKIEDFVIS